MASAAPLLVVLSACGRIGFDLDLEGDETDALVITPAAPTINVGSKVTLDVVGGTAPYELSATGPGTLIGSVFVAPSAAGESTVTATDAAGRTGTTTITYRGDRLFVAGGDVGGTQGSSVLASDDGVSWTQVGDLPFGRANGALIVFDDRMFYLGGLNPQQVPTSDVFASSDGITWTMIGSLPTTTTGFTATIHDGEIWYAGGATSAGNSDEAFHSPDGATWTAAPTRFPTQRHEHDLISRDGRLFIIGGHGDAGFLDGIVSTTDGASWDSTDNVLTFATDFAGVGQLGDRVVRTCGASCTETESSLDLVTWTPGEPIGQARTGPALVDFKGRLLLIGGATTTLATTDGVTWMTIGSLPEARTRTAAVQFTPP